MRMIHAWRACLLLILIATLAPGCTTTAATPAGSRVTSIQYSENQPVSTTAGGVSEREVQIRERIIYEKTEEAYRANGKIWGERLQEEKIEPGKISYPFLLFLLTGEVDADVEEVDDRFYSPDRTYYFRIHSSLKEAFKEGFREGFVDRKADLVLGPHFPLAGAIMGEANARLFELKMKDFYTAQTTLLGMLGGSFDEVIDSSVEVFKELIAEGSPADREAFRDRFLLHYGKRVESFIHSRGEYEPDQSAQIHLHFSANEDAKSSRASTPFNYNATFATIMAPELWELIYRRSLSEVGQEMGERLVNNLIRREELLEWLRRTRTALDDLTKDIEIIRSAFRETYGRDADTVFNSLLKDIGFAG